MGKPGRFLHHVLNLDLYVAGLAMAVLIVITVSGVFMRYVANSPYRWAEEVQLWCFVWVIFPGACVVARTSGHIAIDALIAYFPEGIKNALLKFTRLVTMFGLCFLGYYAARYVYQMHMNGRVTNILGVPYALIYAVVPLSCLIMLCITLWLLVTGTALHRSEEAGDHA